MAESRTESPGAKAIRYAEETLGVHTEYQDAIKARESLDVILTDLSTARDRKRELEGRVSVAEYNVIVDQRTKHPDMSQAAMDRKLKTSFYEDDEVRQSREQLAKCLSDIDGLEMDRSIAEKDIAISTARMIELGGYFQYLSSVKQDQTSRRSNDASSVKDWPPAK